MRIIKTEKLSLNFEEKEVLNCTVSMMEDIMNQADDDQLVNYASAIYDNLVDMLDAYESEV